MRDIYVNPFTDFGFKRLFGEEPHKELLISLLNTLLPEKHQIHDLHYTKNEYQGFTPVERQTYEDSLKYYRDFKNVTDTAKDEGVQEGIEIGKEIGKEEGIVIGVEKGKEIGKEETTRQILSTMYANGMTVEMLCPSA